MSPAASARDEFAIIRDYFAPLCRAREDIATGIGDDAAVLRPAPGRELVVSTDTLVAGVHFFPEVEPAALGHKALAVNLSDLAAMGASPAWATMSLTLPTARDDWLAAFAAGFGDLAAMHGVALVGGDLSRGPLSVTVHIIGSVGKGNWR